MATQMKSKRKRKRRTTARKSRKQDKRN